MQSPYLGEEVRRAIHNPRIKVPFQILFFICENTVSPAVNWTQIRYEQVNTRSSKYVMVVTWEIWVLKTLWKCHFPIHGDSPGKRADKTQNKSYKSLVQVNLQYWTTKCMLDCFYSPMKHSFSSKSCQRILTIIFYNSHPVLLKLPRG